MSTSGPSPASAMWNRLPLALTVRWLHGPGSWTADSAFTTMRRVLLGDLWLLAVADNLGAVAVGTDRRLVAVAAQHAEALGDRLAGPLQAGQALQPQDGDADRRAGQQHAGAGHDEERRPGPDAERDQPEGEGDAQQDEHQAAHEGGHAGQRPGQPAALQVPAQLGLGQVDLVADQLGHVLGGQGHEITE